MDTFKKSCNALHFSTAETGSVTKAPHIARDALLQHSAVVTSNLWTHQHVAWAKASKNWAAVQVRKNVRKLLEIGC